MRSALKTIEGISEIETDVNELTVQFRIAEGIDVENVLNSIAESNNKLKDWSLIENE